MARWTLLMLPLLMLALPACRVVGGGLPGSGTIVSEKRDATGFRRVAAAGIGTVVLVRSAEEGVVVETDDNLMACVRTEVRDGTLYLDTAGKGKLSNPRPTQGVTFTVSFTSLEEIAVSGAADVTADSVEAAAFSIAVSGAGDVSVGNLKAESLSVAVSGAGDIAISGAVGAQEIAISGAGSYKAADLASRTAVVGISGTGGAVIWATETLEARVSGVGSVSYYGEPVVTKSVSGMGDVKSLGSRGTEI
ncbi:MAG: DUF2807 domain-containing protein [Candidatus Eisenbacteria bacterium]|nr:DUF2807 domain-containing protein [Candidatus Eisenbacteria bacterium]